MIVLAHRGAWRTGAEQNTPAAVRRAFEGGFGIETDLRDCAGRIVIAHDPPGADAWPFDRFVALAAAFPRCWLALNVKADGLAAPVTAAMRAAGLVNWFAFDMAVPDSLAWRRQGAPFFTRRSEFEAAGPLDAAAQGIWLDAFESDWWSGATVAEQVAAGRHVAIVSPELHGRPPEPVWDRLAAVPESGRARLMLCTDFPERAAARFRPGDQPGSRPG